MGDDVIGFTAVLLGCSIPLAVIYALYRVRALKTKERLAAIEKGVAIPLGEDLPPHARSRRAGVLLVSCGLGYTLTFLLLTRYNSGAFGAAAFGIIPIAVGIGYFIDAMLLRRELRPAA